MKKTGKKKTKKVEEKKEPEKEEILEKLPEKKVEEKKEDISKKTLSDWKDILIQGFSLDPFQKQSQKENFSLESSLEEVSKKSSFKEQGYSINREYEEKEKESSKDYSLNRRAPFIPQIRSDFSSLGKANSFFQEFHPTFNSSSGDSFESEEQPNYSSLKAEKFSRETKSFSQIERESFEGIKTHRGYKEVKL